MSKKYIERGWESYLKHVMPKDAPPIQLKETRQAFFCGAAILFNVLMIDLSEGDEVKDEDVQHLDDVQKELDAFGQEIDADLLGIVRH